LKEDAGVMESFTRMNVSLKIQAIAINEFKAHVDALLEQEAKLQEAKGALLRGKRRPSKRLLRFWTNWRATPSPSSTTSMVRPSTLLPSTRTISKPTPTMRRNWRP
jgi:hypothetical protein